MQVELVSLQSDEGICVKGSVQAGGVGFRVTSQATGWHFQDREFRIEDEPEDWALGIPV